MWAPKVSRGFESHPVRSIRSDSSSHGPEIRLAEPRETPSFSEGWQNGNAPVSKTGALTGLRVRIPPPPLDLQDSLLDHVGQLDQFWTNRAEKHVPSTGFLNPPNGKKPGSIDS